MQYNNTTPTTQEHLLITVSNDMELMIKRCEAKREQLRAYGKCVCNLLKTMPKEMTEGMRIYNYFDSDRATTDTIIRHKLCTCVDVLMTANTENELMLKCRLLNNWASTKCHYMFHYREGIGVVVHLQIKTLSV